jgi:hypothetical protein
LRHLPEIERRCEEWNVTHAERYSSGRVASAGAYPCWLGLTELGNLCTSPQPA